MVGFVDDDEIEAAAGDVRSMLAAARQRERSDHALLRPEPRRVAAQQRVMGRGAGDVKLGLEFLAPLPDQ